MQSSNMSGKRPDSPSSYGSSGSSGSGRTAPGHGEARDSASSFSADSMAARSSADGSGVISRSTTTQAKVDPTPGRWEQSMGRRLLLLLAMVPAPVAAGTAAAKPSQPASWAAAQIRAVTTAGVMDGTSVATFRASDPLTAQSLENLAFALKTRLA